jgi:hypothetical protein
VDEHAEIIHYKHISFLDELNLRKLIKSSNLPKPCQCVVAAQFLSWTLLVGVGESLAVLEASGDIPLGSEPPIGEKDLPLGCGDSVWASTPPSLLGTLPTDSRCRHVRIGNFYTKLQIALTNLLPMCQA